MRAVLLCLCLLPAASWARLDLTPRIGVYAALDETEQVRVPFTLGFAIQPTGRGRVTAFIAPQLDMDVSREYALFAPTLRFGILLRDDDDEWSSNFASWLRVYGIAGMRLPGEGRSGYRAGFGMDSGVGLLLTAIGFKHGVPIPNAIEVVWESIGDDQPGSVVVHLGIAI